MELNPTTSSINANIITLNEKFANFKRLLYLVNDNRQDDNIKTLESMTATEFVAAASMFIQSAGSNAAPEQLEAALLSKTGTSAQFAQIPDSTKVKLRQYCSYFYELAIALGTQE